MKLKISEPVVISRGPTYEAAAFALAPRVAVWYIGCKKGQLFRGAKLWIMEFWNGYRS